MRRSLLFYKTICLILVSSLLFQNSALTEVSFYPSPPATLPFLRYLSLNSANPFNYFNFLLDPKEIENPEYLIKEAKKLINYFFLGITLADEAFWVNLQPDQSDKITSSELSKTDLGKILLEQDLLLKKDMAGLLHPKSPIGRTFWNRLYSEADKLLGKAKLKKTAINTSNRVWITPDKAVVLETEDGALIVEASLKVLLESEYLKLSSKKISIPNDKQSSLNLISEQLMKEIIIPEITKKVNESPSYSPLRQIYHSLILAQWFKRKIKSKREKVQSARYEGIEEENKTIHQAPITQHQVSPYELSVDRGWTDGLESEIPWKKDLLFQEYLKSYTQGEYKLTETISGLKRMYFSGGIVFWGRSAGGSSPITITSKKDIRQLPNETSVLRSQMIPGLLQTDPGKNTFGSKEINLVPPLQIKEEIQASSSIVSPKTTERSKLLPIGKDTHTLENLISLAAENNPEAIHKLKNLILDSPDTSTLNTLIFWIKKYDPNTLRALDNLAKSIDKNLSFDKILQDICRNLYPFSPLRQLAENPMQCGTLVKQYKEVVTEIENTIQGLFSEKDSNYKDDVSIGAQAAIKLKTLELLIEGESVEKIKNFIAHNFLPTLEEEKLGALLPIGTEVEIRRREPYTESDYYPVNLVNKIWKEVLELPLDGDGLIEFSLPPSRSNLTQIIILDSMIKLGLIPPGWFSLHISVGLPLDINYEKAILKIAPYLELIKAILYTSGERLNYFARKHIPLRFKGRDVSEVKGKKSPFSIHPEDKGMTRVEYRSGDIVVPNATEFSNYHKSISFIQIAHSLMVLTIIAAVDPQKIENKFMQELLEILNDFISEIDKWKVRIPKEYEALQKLFEDDLLQQKKELETIIGFRKEHRGLVEDLDNIIKVFGERVVVTFSNVEETVNRAADSKAVRNLAIVQRLKEVLPEKPVLSKDIFSTPHLNYLNNIKEIPRETFITEIFRSLTSVIPPPPAKTSPIQPLLKKWPIVSAENPWTVSLQIQKAFRLDDYRNPPVFSQLSITPPLLPLPLIISLPKKSGNRLRSYFSPERRAFRRAIKRNIYAYREIGANINHHITKRAIQNAAFREAARELGIPEEELRIRLSLRELPSLRNLFSFNENEIKDTDDVNSETPREDNSASSSSIEIESTDRQLTTDNRGGIDLSEIELILQDKEFISSLNPADLKILLAAETLKRYNWNSLALLRIHEVIGILRDGIVEDFQNKELLLKTLEQLNTKFFLDPQALQFLHFLQSKKTISELRLSFSR